MSVDSAFKNPGLLGLQFAPFYDDTLSLSTMCGESLVKSSRDICGCGQVFAEILAHMGFKGTFLVVFSIGACA